MKQPLNEQFRRMQKLAGILNENEENPKPSYITIGFNNQSKFMKQYKTDGGKVGDFTYHDNRNGGNWSKLQNGELELENGYCYPMFRCVTDSEKFEKSKYTEGFNIVYLRYLKENNEVSILISNESIDMTGNNNQDKFKSLADATKFETQFEKVEAGEIDDRGYFEIVAVK